MMRCIDGALHMQIELHRPPCDTELRNCQGIDHPRCRTDFRNCSAFSTAAFKAGSWL